MITNRELSLYLHQFLECQRYNDYAPNGMQIAGKDQIKLICTAVSAAEEVIDQARALMADALLVHHGYFWRGESPVIHSMKGQRIHKLLDSKMNLFAYHLPLDCHIQLGNNACLAELFEADLLCRHKANSIENLLWSGSLSQTMRPEEFSEFLAKKLQRPPLFIAAHHKPIKHIAWCSGAAQDLIEEASDLGVDAYLSGEVSERTYYQAKELGIHYYSCGHHATERYGIQALGKHLAGQFNLEHVFLDTDNPI